MAEPASISGINASLEVQISGVWYDVAGVNDFSASGGEAPETDLITYAGVGKATGHARVPTVSASIGIYNPVHETFRLLRENAGKRLPWRLTTQEGDVVGDPGDTTVAVTAATGAILVAPGGASDDWEGLTEDDRIRRGMVIKPTAGTNRYVIARITSNMAGFANVVEGAVPALAATDAFTIVEPAIRNSFIATVRSGSAFDLPGEGALNTTLALTPASALNNWSIAA